MFKNVNPIEYYGGVIVIAIPVGFMVGSLGVPFIIIGVGLILGSFMK
jgi:hypothetical protein